MSLLTSSMSPVWLLGKLGCQSYGATLVVQPVLRSKMNAVIVNREFEQQAAEHQPPSFKETQVIDTVESTVDKLYLFNSFLYKSCMNFHLVCCLMFRLCKPFCRFYSVYILTCVLSLWLLCQCAGSRAVGCRNPPVQYVIVPALPRGANVEWQVTAVTDAVNWQGLLCVLSA